MPDLPLFITICGIVVSAALLLIDKTLLDDRIARLFVGLLAVRRRESSSRHDMRVSR